MGPAAKSKSQKILLSKYLQSYSVLVKWAKQTCPQELAGFEEAVRMVNKSRSRTLFLCADRKIGDCSQLRRLGSFCRFTFTFTYWGGEKARHAGSCSWDLVGMWGLGVPRLRFGLVKGCIGSAGAPSDRDLSTSPSLLRAFVPDLPGACLRAFLLLLTDAEVVVAFDQVHDLLHVAVGGRVPGGPLDIDGALGDADAFADVLGQALFGQAADGVGLERHADDHAFFVGNDVGQNCIPVAAVGFLVFLLAEADLDGPAPTGALPADAPVGQLEVVRLVDQLAKMRLVGRGERIGQLLEGGLGPAILPLDLFFDIGSHILFTLPGGGSSLDSQMGGSIESGRGPRTEEHSSPNGPLYLSVANRFGPSLGHSITGLAKFNQTQNLMQSKPTKELTDTKAGNQWTMVVMAKAPVAGKVKTRLIPQMGPQGAAEVYKAMLQCILQRARRLNQASNGGSSGALSGGAGTGISRYVLACDMARQKLDEDLVRMAGDWELIEQGPGDLGEKMTSVWRQIGGGPAIFIGADSPDIPMDMLTHIPQMVSEADVGIGQAADGGYWTLAATRMVRQILVGIDWGSSKVYHQTCKAIDHAGLRVVQLGSWHDVDEIEDLDQLAARLADATEPTLIQLRQRLQSIWQSMKDSKLTDPSTQPSTQANTQTSTQATSQAITQPGTQPGTQPDTQSEIDYSECTLLIVDDNAQNVELLQAYLEALSCKIATAFDGIEALAMIDDPAEPTPDVILLDIMMPKMSGYEVCRKLKEDPSTRSIPIIMVTALNELGDIERGVECGTDDFLTKPVNKLELVTRVKSFLRFRHLKKEMDRTMAYIQQMDPKQGGQTQSDPGNP